ncbi:uncharacterized protein LOC132904259 [Amyelois transitella]|uniref:uncharacterized protein LOC106141768 n=1 Tax=Amyelois transitella TaxID=680683 RepID=UPI00067B3BA8|nr:uncharacterized protein LOC106141768 [Amyelois transitella]XP_060810158.1 uncharacterized protein LOC106141768 [Amyelois transitella]XP_060810169.1 uncharacterized protein LOC132904259 [Amyelois transitella]
MEEEFPSCSIGQSAITHVKRNGGTVLLRGGHQYVLKEKYKNGTAAWECINRKKQKCGGKITVKDNQIVTEKRHECQPDFIKNEIDEALFKCKQDVSSPEFPTVTSVYNAAVASYKNSGFDLIQKIPPLKSVKSTLYRARNASKGMKKIKYTNLAEVEIPSTCMDFLLADYSYDEQRILVFSSQRSRAVISQGKHFMGDGTFKSCPTPFLQLYTIHCDIGSTDKSTNIIPVAYALLSSKDTDTYEKLFYIIKSQIPDWNPITFKTDFEMAAMNAIISVFPNVIRKGCYFHFSKAVWKKGKDLGLTKSKITRRQVALCAVLPYLPQDQIFNGWFYIAAHSPDDKKSKIFRKYMVTQWLRDDFIPLWCVFGERHRTTNNLESWHNKLNKLIKKKQPNIVELIKALQSDASYYEVISQQDRNVCNRLKQSIHWDNFILEKTLEFIDGQITIGHLLEMLR